MGNARIMMAIACRRAFRDGHVENFMWGKSWEGEGEATWLWEVLGNRQVFGGKMVS